MTGRPMKHIASVALACLLLSSAASARAQALAYVTAALTDKCSQPPVNFCSTQGVVHVYSATTAQIQQTFTIWRDGPTRQVFTATAAMPAGDRVYLVAGTFTPPLNTPATSLIALDTTSGSTRQVSSG